MCETENMISLSPNSKVTISLLISLLGGSAFITKIYFQSEANASNLKDLKQDIKDDLKEIKFELKEIRKSIKE